MDANKANASTGLRASLRNLPVNVWIVTATSFLTDISSEMIVYLVPLFLSNVLMAGTAVIGLIEGLAETTASLMKIYSGALSDKLGKRKWITVVGYGLSAIAKPFMYFATTWHWVLGVRLTDRLGKGIRTAPRDALVAGSIDEKQRGLAFGLHRAGDTAGAFFGLMIAAIIVWLTQSGAADLTRRTFQIVILASIIPALLAVLVLAIGARDIAGEGKSKAPIQPERHGWPFQNLHVGAGVVHAWQLFGCLHHPAWPGTRPEHPADYAHVDDLQPDLFPPLWAIGCTFRQGWATTFDHRRLDHLRAGLSRLCTLENWLADLDDVRIVWRLLRCSRGCG
jgi:nitrate/nitrite transporter NarK